MSYRLFLDDERMPKDVKWVELPLGPWEIVRSYEAFVKTITEKGMPTFISFDHDLADEHYKEYIGTGKVDYNTCKEKTGFHCALWLVDYCLDKPAKLPLYVVHSMNSVGRENINGLLAQFKRVQSTP
jgi:hypothetical protein